MHSFTVCTSFDYLCTCLEVLNPLKYSNMMENWTKLHSSLLLLFLFLTPGGLGLVTPQPEVGQNVDEPETGSLNQKEIFVDPMSQKEAAGGKPSCSMPPAQLYIKLEEAIELCSRGELTSQSQRRRTYSTLLRNPMISQSPQTPQTGTTNELNVTEIMSKMEAQLEEAGQASLARLDGIRQDLEERRKDWDSQFQNYMETMRTEGGNLFQNGMAQLEQMNQRGKERFEQLQQQLQFPSQDNQEAKPEPQLKKQWDDAKKGLGSAWDSMFG